MQTIAFVADAIVWLMGIIVLIKLFQKGGLLKGILGLICMLYTFYWGWRNAKAQNLTTVMWVWTGLVVLLIVLNVLATTGGGGDASQGFLLHLM
jgi:membrane-bound ClpP family serine protease